MNPGFRWQARGLAGLVTMLEAEAEADPNIDASTLRTLVLWRDRLSAVLGKLRGTGEGQLELPSTQKRSGGRYVNG